MLLPWPTMRDGRVIYNTVWRTYSPFWWLHDIISGKGQLTEEQVHHYSAIFICLIFWFYIWRILLLLAMWLGDVYIAANVHHFSFVYISLPANSSIKGFGIERDITKDIWIPIYRQIIKPLSRQSVTILCTDYHEAFISGMSTEVRNELNYRDESSTVTWNINGWLSLQTWLAVTGSVSLLSFMLSPLRVITSLPIEDNWGPFYKHDSTLIPAWISNHVPCKLWKEITYPFLNFNDRWSWEWKSNCIPHLIMDAITYPCCD